MGPIKTDDGGGIELTIEDGGKRAILHNHYGRKRLAVYLTPEQLRQLLGDGQAIAEKLSVRDSA